jgi:hypothetical protein
MNISSLTSSNAAAMGIGAGSPSDFRARMQQSLAPVAKLFGMTSDQLMSAVKSSGGSLADYAASKGISNADLTAAIKQGLQDNAPNGVQLSDTQLTNLAQRIEHHKPGDAPQGRPPAGTTDAIGANSGASSLKTDIEKLIADLKTLDSTSTSGATSTATDGAGAASSNPTSALLDALVRIDQRL